MTWWEDDEQPTEPSRRAAPDPTLPPQPTAVWWPPEPAAGLGAPPRGGGPGGGFGPPPPAGPPAPRGQRPRRRRGTLWALLAAAVLAVGAGGLLAYASGGHSGLLPTATNSSTSAPANPVSQAKLDPSAIAARNDPAIVDVTATIADGTGEAAGTGVVLTSSGEILTNNHVIENASAITVKISNRSESYTAVPIGTDVVDDIAVLQAQGASGLTTIPLGNSSQLSVGDGVVAIGNAFNRSGPPTVTQGSVTALGRSITVRSDTGGSEQLNDLIETDAQLEPGNSGGPLFDATGKVIGINTAASTGGGYGEIPQNGSNDGFAIPINNALAIVHQIDSGKSGGNANVGPSGFLGVGVSDVAGGFGGSLGGNGSSAGVQVQNVQSGSPAANAGIARGDQITAIDGQSVSSSTQLTQIISSKHPNDMIRVTWLDQAGDQHTATVRLAKRSSAA
jgi:S1-C subfamily serine protease